MTAQPVLRADQKHERVRGGGMEAAGGGFSYTRTEIRRSETEQPCQGEGIGTLEGAASGPALEAKGGFAEVAGGEAEDEIGSEGEPASEAS